MKELFRKIDAEHIFEAVELSGILEFYSVLNQLAQNKNHIGISNLNRWCKFFNQHITETPCIYKPMIEACGQAAEESELFNSLSGHEFHISTEFFKMLYREKSKIILSFPYTAYKLLHISLIFGKYPGMVVRSFRNYIPNLNKEINTNDNEQLFKWLFVKYEAPMILVRHLESMSLSELEYLMFILKGNKPNEWIKASIQLTKKESRLLFNNAIQHNNFKDNILLRSMISCRLYRNNETKIQYLITFLRYSRLFQNDLSRFTQNLNFWKRAFDFICKIDFNLINLSIEEIIDYFDFISRTRGETYSFKGRTVNSITNHIHNWHVQAEFDKLDVYIEDRWHSMGIHRQEITYKNTQYQFYELISGKLLKRESKRMSHCVYSYVPMCINGNSHIFSMEEKCYDGKYPLLTIEVRNKAIVQALGLRNRDATENELNAIVLWADKVGLNSDQVKPSKKINADVV